MAYLQAFATLDWHLGRLALAIDLPVVTRDELLSLPATDLAEMVLAIQPGTHYVHATWPIDELMTLYLSNAAPAQFVMADTEVWIEARGARGALRLSRLTAAEYSFRVAVADGLPIGEAAQRAWRSDPTFDPGLALAAVVDSELVTSIGLSVVGVQHA